MNTPLSCIACHTRGGAVSSQMKGFQSILRIFHIFFSVSCDTEAVIAFSFDTKRIFLFTYDTGSKLTCDSVFFSRGDFLAESSGMSEVIAFVGDHASLSEASVSYDRQCKIKRCPQNGLTAYTIVLYVWTSERFCGQSGHGNFRGRIRIASVFDSVHSYLTVGTVTL